MGGGGLLPIRAGKGDSFEPFGDGDGGVFKNSEGVVEGEDHVPEVSGVGHEALCWDGDQHCGHGR